MRYRLLLIAGFLCILAMPLPANAQYNYTTNGNTIAITGYTGAGGVVTIPDTTNGFPVTSIGVNAFGNNSTITSVTLGNNITNIGDWSFGWCVNLTSITLDSKLTSIGSYALYFCYRLNSVTLGNNITNISDYAFADCTGLTGLYFESNAPASFGLHMFNGDNNAIVYRLPGTAGWAALLAGLPTAIWSLPKLSTPARPAGLLAGTNNFGFNVSGTSGQTVVVEACTNLVKAVWLAVQTNTYTSNSIYFSYPKPAGFKSYYYRIRIP